MKMIKLVAVSFTAAMALIGCQEEMMEDVAKTDSYHASMEAFGADTKTALGEGRQVVWSSDDRDRHLRRIIQYGK
jgi:enamine deaminase RidA (YjgF/YER057c/UK114 family)